MYEFIREGSLALRQILIEDKDLFLQWHNDLELREQIGGFFPFTQQTFWEILEQRNINMPLHIWFGVCLDEDLIGVAGFHNIKYLQGNAEIAFLIGENKYRNCGYGTSGVKMLKEYAFHILNMHRLYACVYSENVASVKVLHKCSFVKEGTLKEASYWNGKYRDIIIYAILCEKNR